MQCLWGQRIGCNCKEHNKEFTKWEGFFPGEKRAEELGIDLNAYYRGYRHEFTEKDSSKGSKIKGGK